MKSFIFIVFSLVGGFFIYLYHFYIPAPISVNINYTDSTTFNKFDVFSTSFLYNETSLTCYKSGNWTNETGLVRKIKIYSTQNNFKNISSIDLQIGNQLYYIDKENVTNSIVPQNKNYIEISALTIKKGVWFYTFGLLNHQLQYKLLLRAIFAIFSLCFIVYILFYFIKKIKWKSISLQSFAETESYSIIPIKHLEFFSIILLVIPFIIFLLGYIKLQYSSIITILIFIVLYKIFVNSFLNAENHQAYSKKKIITILLISMFMISFSGIGGLGFQTGDWEKHNFVLSDLISHQWPVIYNHNLYSTTDVNSSSLVFYIAYYMFPALVGKIGGWSAANYALIIQSIIALFLSLCWVLYFVKNTKYLILISFIFLFFSGFDIIGNYLGNFDMMFFDKIFHFEIYTTIQYSSFTSQLFWVPHHAFSAWLSISLIIYYFQKSDNFYKILFIFSIVCLWSVYAAVGLIPFVIAYFIIHWKETIQSIFKNYIIIIASIFILLICFLFYLSKSNTIIVSSVFVQQDTLAFILFYVEFTIIEWFIVFYLIQKNNILKNKNSSILLLISTLILLALPFIQFPSYYDFTARASIPSLFIINVLLLRIIFESETSRKIKFAINVLLLLGFSTSMNEFGRSAKFIVENSIQVPPKMNEKSTLPLLSNPKYAKQYFGNENSFFFRYLCK